MSISTLKPRTAQIGRCGELLVQYRLLRRGIESAPMTTDNGIDLVAYSPINGEPRTIQVKSNLLGKPGGGKGSLALDWWISEASPAALVALVDLERSRVWLLTQVDLSSVAQQRSGGRLHFYMYSDPDYTPKRTATHVREFDHFLLENTASSFFN